MPAKLPNTVTCKFSAIAVYLGSQHTKRGFIRGKARITLYHLSNWKTVSQGYAGALRMTGI